MNSGGRDKVESRSKVKLKETIEISIGDVMPPSLSKSCEGSKSSELEERLLRVRRGRMSTCHADCKCMQYVGVVFPESQWT